MKPVPAEALAFAKHIMQLVAQGLDRDAVLERLADPAGVGSKMIDRSIARREAGAEYLGRAETVMVVEEPWNDADDA